MNEERYARQRDDPRRKPKLRRAYSFLLCLAGLCGHRLAMSWPWAEDLKRYMDFQDFQELQQVNKEDAGMLFGLTEDNRVHFHAKAEGTVFVQLRGEPCDPENNIGLKARFW